MSADALDDLGLPGAIPGSVLRPTDPQARIVGPALTVLSRPSAMPVAEAVRTNVSRLGEIEAHNLATAGDVLVIQGVIFVACVLLFRRGIVGELANWLRIKL